MFDVPKMNFQFIKVILGNKDLGLNHKWWPKKN